MQSKTLSNYP